MKKIGLIIMALVCTITGFSQGEEFKPSGKPIMRIYTNYHTTFVDGESKNEFGLERAYLGYSYNFAEEWKGIIVFDVGNPKDGGDFEMTAFVKNAMVSYHKNNLTVNFGLIGTTSFKTQEDLWGYRYIEKCFQDLYKFSSSADLGLSVAYKFNSTFSADFIIEDGEGYKELEQDSIFNVGVGVTANLMDGLLMRAYYETSTHETTEQKAKNTFAFVANYQNEKFSLGGEYTNQNNSTASDGSLDMDGFSFYGTYNMKKIKLLARFDKLQSKDNWNTNLDGTRFLIGGEYSPVKGIKFAPNYRRFNAENVGVSDADYVYLNCEIRF